MKNEKYVDSRNRENILIDYNKPDSILMKVETCVINRQVLEFVG